VLGVGSGSDKARAVDCLIERDEARLERKIPTIDQGPHEAPDPLFYALLSRLPVTLREPWRSDTPITLPLLSTKGRKSLARWRRARV